MSDNGTLVGRLALELGISTEQLTDQLTQATRQADRQLTNAFSDIGKKIGGILGGLALGSFVKDCLDLGSDLAEVQNVVDTAFKSMSSEVDKFAQNAMECFGLSETVAKQYMGTIGAMNNAFGFTEQASIEMAEAVTGLAGDVSSFYNLDSDEAFTKLKSIWTGETEALKDLGVVMTQTALDQYALNNGFGKTTAKMTEQEKVMLRYQFVTESLADAVGDFAKTEDSWANQTRVLSLRFDSLKATLGQGFINLFTPIVKSINALLAKLSTAAEMFKEFTEVLMGHTDAADSLENIAGMATEAASGVDAITSSAKEAQKQLMGFDKITKLSDNSSDSSDSDTSGAGAGAAEALQTLGDASAETSAFAEAIQRALEPLKSISFDNLNESLGKLKENLAALGEKAFEGLKWAYDNILVPLATWTIENLLPAFIDLLSGALSVLNTVLEVLQPVWIWVWDNLFTPLADWAGAVTVGLLEDLADTLDAIGKNKNLVKVLTTLTASLVAYKAGGWAMTALTGLHAKLLSLSRLGKIAVTIAVAAVAFETGEWLYKLITGDQEDYSLDILFDSNWEDIKAGIDLTIEDWKDGMSIIGEDIKEGVDGFVGDWKDGVTLMEEYASDSLENVGQYFSDCTDEIYTCWVEPVLENAAELWEDIKGVFSGIGTWFKEKFEGAKNGIKNAWSSVTGFFSGIRENISTSFSNIGTWFKEKFESAKNGVTNAWSSVTGFFSGIWEGIKSCFSAVGNWFKDTFTSAWEGVKNVFTTGGKIFDGVTEGIAENFKNVVNAIIRGINKVIEVPFDKINSMLNDIRSISILGAKPFEGLWDKDPLSVPQIPQLAQGAYVKPNTPQLAMIGDNRHQGEIVAPEDKLQELADNAAGNGGISKAELESLMNNAVMRIVSALGQVGFYIGTEEIAKVVMAGAESLDSRYNPVKFV